MTAYAEMMATGSQAYAAHEYSTAATSYLAAFGLAQEGSLEQGRAARDAAASYFRLRDLPEATRCGTLAFTIHDGVITAAETAQMPVASEMLRERGISAGQVAKNGLQAIIQAKRNGQHGNIPSVLEYAQVAHDDLAAAAALQNTQSGHTTSPPDQYEINFASTWSLALTFLETDKQRGKAAAYHAARLALQSESPRLPTHNPNLSPTRRLRAKARALTKAGAAMLVNRLTAYDLPGTKGIMLYAAERAL